MVWIILPAAAVLLILLLSFETRGRPKGRLISKTALSLLFLAAALSQPVIHPGFYYWLLSGLILCLGGDVFLALSAPKMFLYGLVSFLLGHVAYIIAFLALTGFNVSFSMAQVVIAIVSGAVFLYFRPRLGSMLAPVAAYIIVISLMLAGAWLVMENPAVSRTAARMIFTGALLFYLSDLFVARQRFVKQEALNRLIGLPLYYGGQFLLAYSLGSL